MESGGTISIDISSTKLIDTKSKTCPHITSTFYIEIYVVNEEEFSIIHNTDDYTENDCYDIDSETFDSFENCWYYKKATQKFFIPINNSLTTINTINYSSLYRVIIINPCRVEYSIKV